MNLAHTSIPRLSRSLIRGCRRALDNTSSSFSPGSIRPIEEFAKRFTRFEWIYLCSYRWFIAALDNAVYRGSFVALQLRAEKKLINEGLRRRPATLNERSSQPSRLLND